MPGSGAAAFVVNTRSLFVEKLVVPLNVVFHAPDPLFSRQSDITSTGSEIARSHTTRHLRRRDVMSRDHGPETAGGVVEERASVCRHDVLSRPRSRSVCSGKYCTVRDRVTRPQSASNTPRPPSLNPHRHRPHHWSAAATGRQHVARQPVNDDVTVDDDATTTSKLALGDSGVSRDRSRDREPWTVQGLMDCVDRQSQLRRFLDAVSQTSSSSSSPPADIAERQDIEQASADSAPSDDMSESDDDDDSEHSVSSDGDQLTSAMDQVRHLVTRCRLPVYTSTQTGPADAARRVDTWTRTINQHHATSTSSVIQTAILGAAAGLVRANCHVRSILTGNMYPINIEAT